MPIPQGKSIALLGDAVDKPYYVGDGSAGTQLSQGVKGLKECIEEIYPNSVKAKFRLLGHTGMLLKASDVRTTYIKNALDVAYDNDYTVFVVGNSENIESESFDRSSFKLAPTIEKAILDLAEMTDKLIVVIEAGSAIDVSNWIDKVNGVIFAGFAGEGVNTALAEILTGRVNPSGRLSETFPKKIEDIPDYDNYMDGLVEWYKEGIFVGYRHYDKFNKEVQFPFGFGLSYADFAYSNLVVKKVTETEYVVSYYHVKYNINAAP